MKKSSDLRITEAWSTQLYYVTYTRVIMCDGTLVCASAPLLLMDLILATASLYMCSRFCNLILKSPNPLGSTSAKLSQNSCSTTVPPKHTLQ